MKKIAVILCGSGFKDGSEIREAVAVLWALSKEGAEAAIFALDEPQTDVVNCFTGSSVPGESRNQMVESARIARGQVRPLSELHVKDFSGLVIPGGFGAAKNLCDFAMKGGKGTVHPLVAECLRSFHKAGKPIGAVCIAPAILALAFKGQSFELTLGGKSEAAEEVVKLGHKHVEKRPTEFHLDKKNKVLSTPAYMHESAPLHEIFTGVHGMVSELCRIS